MSNQNANNPKSLALSHKKEVHTQNTAINIIICCPNGFLLPGRSSKRTHYQGICRLSSSSFDDNLIVANNYNRIELHFHKIMTSVAYINGSNSNSFSRIYYWCLFIFPKRFSVASHHGLRHSPPREFNVESPPTLATIVFGSISSHLQFLATSSEFNPRQWHCHCAYFEKFSWQDPLWDNFIVIRD